jgi:predicted DNA-binding transcriptional regulator YafY
MKETSARLLRVLTLLQIRRTWSGREIADRLRVSTRTVRRDMDKLRELDYPVNAGRGIVGGYSLGAGAQLPPLLLDDDEAVAIAITLRTAAASGVTGIGETALRALIKLEQVLPSRLRNRVKAVQLSMLQAPGRGPTVDPGVLTSIGAACRDHQRLRFDYLGVGDASSVHVTEPHQLITWGSRWYLVAWDVERDDWNAFQVDRIRLRHMAGARFTPRRPPTADVATHVARSVAQLWPAQAALRLQTAARHGRSRHRDSNRVKARPKS